MSYITINKDMNVFQTGLQLYQFGETKIFIDGLIYAYGKKAGKETVEWLNEMFCETGIVPYEELRGSFSCVIVRKERITAFSDNSNMHCLYYTNDVLSSSFLKIVQYETECGRELDFDLESICEYLTIGNIFFDKTFFTGIQILSSTEVGTIENGKITISKKAIGDIDEKSRVNSFGDFFDKLSYSLSDMRVCQALTGGYDSRLIYICLSKRIKDHPSISANTQDNKEVKCAQKVAITNQDNLEVISVEKPCFSDDVIFQLFEKNDGMIPFDIDADIRLLKYKNVLSKKYNVLITGDSGVLHKDWEWIQDFPFYKRKKSNAKQFYRQRLYYLSNESHIGEKLIGFFGRQEQRFVEKLDSIAKQINTQSYDSWYFHVSGNRRTEYNCKPSGDLVSYAPLDEIDLVRYSYALPRWKRFFFNSMREAMTKENRQAARIKTNYGTNASNEIPYLFVDAFFQSVEYLRKAYRLISRKLTHKNVSGESVLDWNLENEMRNSEIAYNAIEYAKEKGFIRELPMDSFSYPEIQRLVHIYCLSCFATE